MVLALLPRCHASGRLYDALGGAPAWSWLMREARGQATRSVSLPRRAVRLRVLGVRLLEGSSPRPQLAGSRAARLRSNCSAAMTGVLGHQARQKRGAFFGVRGYALTGSRGIP